ncbi:MAG: hypothetical protein AAFZ15_25955 [Bacteroidota bacterium]
MKLRLSLSCLLKYLPVLGCIAILAACTNPPDYPVEPAIEFVSVSKDTLQRGSLFNDTTFIKFSFTDGDGDIGDDENGDELRLFLTDSRNGFVNDLRIPYVLEPGASNGIRGEITARVFTSCCIFPEVPPFGVVDGCLFTWDEMPYDSLTYDIYIEDRAGNRSNIITTSPIYIRCFE